MLTHFETSVFELFTFTSTNSTFSLLECLLCLFFPSFRSSSIHLFSLLSRRVFSFLFLCSLFLFLFFLVLDCLFNFLFLFSSFLQKTRFCSFPFLLDMFHIDFSCFVLFFCFEKWFLVFVLTLLYCFLLLLLHIQFLIYSFPVLMYLKKCCFFQQIGEDIFCFSLSAIFLFFFFCSLVVVFFFFFEKVCVTNPFIFEHFLEFLVNPFSLFTFFSQQNSAKKPSFFVIVQSFFFSLFLSTFSLFLSSLFL